MEKVRILLVDDHEVVRRGVVGLIEDSRPDWEVCGQVSTGREAIFAAAALHPGMIVMDISMPDMDGLEATRTILRASPDAEILIFSMHASEHMVHDTLTAGARGYVIKRDTGKDLISALDALSQGKPFFSPEVCEVVLNGYLGRTVLSQAKDTYGQLTGREREIVKLVAESKSNKEVAYILQISIKTVESHRSRIMEKLGLHSIADLVRYAVRNKLVEC